MILSACAGFIPSTTGPHNIANRLLEQLAIRGATGLSTEYFHVSDTVNIISVDGLLQNGERCMILISDTGINFRGQHYYTNEDDAVNYCISAMDKT